MSQARAWKTLRCRCCWCYKDHDRKRKTENERKAFVTPMIWLRNRFSIWFDCFSYKWDHFESWFCQWIPHSTFRWSIFVVWCAYTDIAISCNKALNLCRPIPVGSRWGWRWGWEIEGECSVMALIKTYLVIGLMDLKGSKVLTTIMFIKIFVQE